MTTTTMNDVNQKTYDTVKAHLLTQGEQSMILLLRDDLRSPVCAYRGDDARKCAIGCLIPDDKYKPEMDPSGIVSLLKAHGSEILGEYAKSDTELLVSLQRIHDGYDPSSWAEELAILAMELELKP